MGIEAARQRIYSQLIAQATRIFTKGTKEEQEKYFRDLEATPAVFLPSC